MDESVRLRLYCSCCDNTECSIYPLGYIIKDQEGCTRLTTDELKEEYLHQINEVLPFIHLYKNKTTANASYRYIDDMLDKVYNSPLGQKYDKKGKIIPHYH